MIRHSKTLAEVSTFIRNGASIKQTDEASGLRITRIETISDRNINLEKCGYADLGESDFTDYRLVYGDILISHINSEKHLGKCAIFEENRNDIIHGMNLLCLRPDTKVVFPKYLFRYLSSQSFLNLIPKITKKSVNQASFTVTAFKELEIPLPPLEEQKRIAAILDKADAIRRKRQETIKLADEFLRAVFLDMFGDPVTNPKIWNKKQLGELIKLSSGNGLTAKEMSSDGDYLVYGGNGINGKHSEFMFEKPQLIIGRVGVYCGVVHITKPFSWVTDNALYVKEYLQEIDVDFLAMLLEIMNLNQYAGQAAQPLISGGRIYPLEAILPPLDLQKKFSKIKARFNFTQNILNESYDRSEKCFLSLSQKSFSGGL